MRILLLTHFFPPHHLGGTEVFTLGLARALQAAGHTVQVVCAEDWQSAPSHRPDVTDDVVQEVPVRRLHLNWTKAPDVFKYLYNNPEVENYVERYLREFQPDVLHVTSCYSLSASPIMAARRQATPIVVTATDFWFICARNTLLHADGSLCSGPEPWKCARCLLLDTKAYRWTSRALPEAAVAKLFMTVGRFPALTNLRGLRGMAGDWQSRFAYLAQALNAADQVVTASVFLRDQLIRYGMAVGKIQYAMYGLDVRWASEHQQKTQSDRLRVGFIGQILPMKGPDLLLRAVASLGSGVPIAVKIYGDLSKTPAYGRELENLAGQDARITFNGVFDNRQMGQVLSEIDVLVVPSVWYDFPLVIPSAFATKTPVLATDMPGMNEWVQHERNGLLFERNDWHGLAQCLRRLIGDPSILEKLRRGIAPVKSLEQMAEEYSALYQRLQRR